MGEPPRRRATGRRGAPPTSSPPLPLMLRTEQCRVSVPIQRDQDLAPWNVAAVELLLSAVLDPALVVEPEPAVVIPVVLIPAPALHLPLVVPRPVRSIGRIVCLGFCRFCRRVGVCVIWLRLALGLGRRSLMPCDEINRIICRGFCVFGGRFSCGLLVPRDEIDRIVAPRRGAGFCRFCRGGQGVHGVARAFGRPTLPASRPVSMGRTQPWPTRTSIEWRVWSAVLSRCTPRWASRTENSVHPVLLIQSSSARAYSRTAIAERRVAVEIRVGMTEPGGYCARCRRAATRNACPSIFCAHAGMTARSPSGRRRSSSARATR